jgi:hypothetical protein
MKATPSNPYAVRNLILDRRDTSKTQRRFEILDLIRGTPGRSATLHFPSVDVSADRQGRRDLEGINVFENNGVKLLGDELLPYSAVLQAGASVIDLGGITKDFQLQTIDASLRGGWGVSPELATETLLCSVTPNRLSAKITFSNQFAKQQPQLAAAFCEAQIYAAIANELERVCLIGSGIDGEPTGVLFEPITTLDLALTEAAWAQAEREITEDFLGENLAIVVSPLLRESMRNSAVVDDQFGKRLPRLCSPHLAAAGTIPGHVGIVARWSELAVCSWGGIELSTNPYAADTEGNSHLLAQMNVDVIALRTNAFRIVAPSA